MVSSNPDAYVYLAESIRAWPDQAGLGRRSCAPGWEHVAWRNLTGGIVALHRATAAGPDRPARTVAAHAALGQAACVNWADAAAGASRPAGDRDVSPSRRWRR